MAPSVTLARRFARNAALLVGVLAGVGYALWEIAGDCRVASSEACFWGKEYFLLTLGASVVLIGGTVAALVYAGLMWRHRRR